MNKTAIILSGVSGSGKSTSADTLASLTSDCVICSADDYFVNAAGEYKFDPSLLGAAHAYSKSRFVQALIDGVYLVICDNTNTNSREYKFYVDEAEKRGYTVLRWVVDNIHGTKSVHDVPEAVLKQQEKRLIQSLIKEG